MVDPFKKMVKKSKFLDSGNLTPQVLPHLVCFPTRLLTSLLITMLIIFFFSVALKRTCNSSDIPILFKYDATGKNTLLFDTFFFLFFFKYVSQEEKDIFLSILCQQLPTSTWGLVKFMFSIECYQTKEYTE